MEGSSRGFVAQVDNLQQNVAALEEILALWVDAEGDLQLNALETAQLNWLLAYATTSLFFAGLRAKGVETTDHPVKAELERVKLYLKKVSAQTENADDLKKIRPFGIDRAAADRMIRHHTTRN